MKRWGEGRMGGRRSNRVEDVSNFSQVAGARCPPDPPNTLIQRPEPTSTRTTGRTIYKLLLLQRMMLCDFISRQI